MKIALIGTCPSSRMLAPYDDPSWTIWACSEGNMGKLPKVDAWFELHGDLRWANQPAWEEPYFEWLNAAPFTVYAQRLDIFPHAVEFPHEALIREFGPYWFTSSLAWMLAFAIEAEPEEIGIYGCDMAARSEYATQKPALLHLIHVAHERGIKVYVPPESDLLHPPPLYGYFDDMSVKLAIRMLELRQKKAGLERQRMQVIEQLNHDIAALSGNIDELDYITNTYTGARVIEPEAPRLRVVCGSGGSGGAAGTSGYPSGAGIGDN